MIRGPKWKYIRTIFSSLMTTVSLKKLFNHFSNAATTYPNMFSKATDENKTVDLERLAKFQKYFFPFQIT